MLDKLIDVILEFLDKILPCYIVKAYANAVHFRFGKFRNIAEPGFHWKIPLADDIEQHIVATTTLTLPVQSVTTKDGIAVVIKGHIKYNISNLSVFGVAVVDAIDALSDVTCGIIHGVVKDLNWEEARVTDISKAITLDARKEAKKWGISVDRVTITDFAQMQSIRLFNEGGTRLID